MTTIKKMFPDIPFAHRQPKHEGNCKHIHGHNWAFEIEFSAKERDKCGFVVDFGGLKGLKDLLNQKFDHMLVLNADDPLLFAQGSILDKVLDFTGRNLTTVPDCSCEGLAEYVLDLASAFVEHLTEGRATVASVTCYEDSKNSATATKKMQ